MFCSIIIPTVGRPNLTKAVESVLDQNLPNDQFEIIVVNDSGKPLDKNSWEGSEQVRIINTNKRERSVARNTGAAIAKGSYLNFLDDDDWLVDGALQSFWELAQTTKAGWLYGSTELVNRQGTKLIELHHRLNGNCFIQVMAGEWIPLQASLIRTDAFFMVGGFNPLISGPEDIDLLRRISLHHELAEVTDLVACVVRDDSGSTTDYDRHPMQSRWAREQIFNSESVFKRMKESATSSYWHGRIVRAYMTSVIWNLKERRFTSAFSRTVYGVGAMVSSGNYLLSKSFWEAVARPYQSETFERGIKAAKALT